MFKGNMTTALWDTMGKQVDADTGQERHGQACYLVVYPVGTMETHKALKDISREQGEPELVGAGTRIDRVMSYVLRVLVGPESVSMVPNTEVPEYDGIRAGAAWLYGAMAVAKSHGCTRAVIGMVSNDGNLGMHAWDDELGALVTAIHHTYYGT